MCPNKRGAKRSCECQVSLLLAKDSLVYTHTNESVKPSWDFNLKKKKSKSCCNTAREKMYCAQVSRLKLLFLESQILSIFHRFFSFPDKTQLNYYAVAKIIETVLMRLCFLYYVCIFAFVCVYVCIFAFVCVYVCIFAFVWQ
jgi:hypothetical protein